MIRPLGGAFLAIRTVGAVDPVLEVLAGLAAGSVTLSTHGTKASTRLIANHSPEPFSNIVLSVLEDVVVLGLSWLAMRHPLVAAGAVLTFLVVFAFIAPKVYRMLQAQLVFIAGRVRAWLGPARAQLFEPHERALSSLRPRLAKKVGSLLHPTDRLTFAVPCFSGRMRAVGRLVRGVVIGTDSGKVWFVGARTLRTVSKVLLVQGQRIELRRRLLVDEIVFHSHGPDGVVVLRFDKLQAPVAAQLVAHWTGGRTSDASYSVTPTLPQAPAPVRQY